MIEMKEYDFAPINDNQGRPETREGFLCGLACTNGGVCGIGCAHGVGSWCGTWCD